MAPFQGFLLPVESDFKGIVRVVWMVLVSEYKGILGEYQTLYWYSLVILPAMILEMGTGLEMVARPVT